LEKNNFREELRKRAKEWGKINLDSFLEERVNTCLDFLNVITANPTHTFTKEDIEYLIDFEWSLVLEIMNDLESNKPVKELILERYFEQRKTNVSI
jgi:hypothetical protein